MPNEHNRIIKLIGFAAGVPPVKVAEFLLHVLRLRGRMEEAGEEVVMEFTESELSGDESG
jgi:hypothetical protein